jgi:hypothetical protein
MPWSRSNADALAWIFSSKTTFAFTLCPNIIVVTASPIEDAMKQADGVFRQAACTGNGVERMYGQQDCTKPSVPFMSKSHLTENTPNKYKDQEHP